MNKVHDFRLSRAGAAWDPPLQLRDVVPSHLGSSFVVCGPDEGGQRCLRSRACFRAGSTLLAFGSADVFAHPTRMTVQISEHDHVVLLPSFLEYINHSCAPNVRFDVEKKQLIALQPIGMGEELTFFYPATEWYMASPFECVCGDWRCLGRVAGAAQIPVEVLARYQLSPHIARLLAKRTAQTGGLS